MSLAEREDMNDKPIIRHCRNCKYSYMKFGGYCGCEVRYKNIDCQRIRAWFCRYYKPKVSQTQEGI